MNMPNNVEQPKNYNDKTNFIEHSWNKYSQNGEDGILLFIFEKLNIHNGKSCEFGAWDGKKFSNTYNLVKYHNWVSLMIEADSSRFDDLLKTCEESPGIIAVNKKVHYLDEEVSKPDTDLLDNILALHDFPVDFDLLSIDIDGCDYHVWKSLSNYSPKVVVIEHSGKQGHIVQREGAIHKKDIDGSTSFLPMKELGEEVGYTLLCDTGNLIFLKNELIDKL